MWSCWATWGGFDEATDWTAPFVIALWAGTAAATVGIWYAAVTWLLVGSRKGLFTWLILCCCTLAGGGGATCPDGTPEADPTTCWLEGGVNMAWTCGICCATSSATILFRLNFSWDERPLKKNSLANWTGSKAWAVCCCWALTAAPALPFGFELAVTWGPLGAAPALTGLAGVASAAHFLPQ